MLYTLTAYLYTQANWIINKHVDIVFAIMLLNITTDIVVIKLRILLYLWTSCCPRLRNRG